MRTVFTYELVKYRKSKERAQRTNEISDTNEWVRNYCTDTLSMVSVMFIIYILRFKFLFNDKLCCTDSSQKLIKDVSYKLTKDFD